MARIAVFRAETDDGPDVLRWLDRMLIRLVGDTFILHITWVKVFRIIPEYRILRLTFHKKSASKC